MCSACFPDLLFDAAIGQSPVFPLAQCVPAVLLWACSQADFCLCGQHFPLLKASVYLSGSPWLLVTNSIEISGIMGLDE